MKKRNNLRTRIDDYIKNNLIRGKKYKGFLPVLQKFCRNMTRGEIANTLQELTNNSISIKGSAVWHILDKAVNPKDGTPPEWTKEDFYFTVGKGRPKNIDIQSVIENEFPKKTRRKESFHEFKGEFLCQNCHYEYEDVLQFSDVNLISLRARQCPACRRFGTSDVTFYVGERIVRKALNFKDGHVEEVFVDKERKITKDPTEILKS